MPVEEVNFCMDALRKELAQSGVFCMRERLGVVVF